MCFSKPPKMPEPKPAPAPPKPADTTLAAADEQRRQSMDRSGAAQNILTKLSDSDVAASSRKKKLGEG